MRNGFRCCIVVIFLLLLPGSLQRPVAAAAADHGEESFAQFEQELEQIRQELHIPGMAAAIVQNQELVWARGFGYADVEAGIPATPDTPFHLASVTKPVAATLLMQLVEEGALELTEPAVNYGVNLPEGVTVWHLLTHTSEGIPGTSHDYNGSRYAHLGPVISAAAGTSFGELLNSRMLLPLEMQHAAPNPSWYGSGWEGYAAPLGLKPSDRNYANVYRDLARPYQFDENYDNVPGSYPLHFSPAAGLLASVTDLAKFDIALDSDRLVQPVTRELMFAPARSNAGEALIYGLGWYTQQANGTRLVWHSGGWTPSVSALMLKAPDVNLTFIVLANNYNLTRPYRLGDGDVLYSTPALLFYKQFVFPQVTGKTAPTIDWEASTGQLVTQLTRVTDPEVKALLEKELWSYRKLYGSVGERVLANRLLSVHHRVFPDARAARSSPTAAGINDSVPTPIPESVLPHQVVWLSRLLAGWLVLTALALVILLLDLRHNRAVQPPHRLAWLTITLLFGLFGLAAYYVSGGHGKRPLASIWRRALGPALFSVAGNMMGFAAALVIIMVYFPAAPGAIPAVIAMFLCGWLLFRTPFATWTQSAAYWNLLPRSFLVELGSTLFVLMGAMPAALYLMNYLFRDAADSPLFLLIVLLISIAGAVTVYPYTVWLVQRGTYRWAPSGAVEGRPLAQYKRGFAR